MNTFSLQKLTQELLQCAITTSSSLQKSLALENIAPLCQSLAYDLFHQTYQPGTYTRFAVNDPKLREIYAPLFRDRLAQCWLVSQLEPTVECQLIDDTFANRAHKGTLAAIHRVQRLCDSLNMAIFYSWIYKIFSIAFICQRFCLLS